MDHLFEMPDQKFNPCNCRIEIFFLVGLLVSNYDFKNYIIHCAANVYAVSPVSTIKCLCSGGQE